MFNTAIVLLSITGVSIQQQQWTHHDETTWPGQCNVGSEQSPINIELSKTRLDFKGSHIRGPLVFSGYDQVSAVARNTGYTINWAPVAGTPTPMLSGGPLQGNYTFANIHFHWLSEHAFEGLKYPLEMHMVHTKTGLTMAEALRTRDGVAVIGIMANVGIPGSSNVLRDLMPAMPYILEPRSELSPAFTINLTSMFHHPQEYYTYHGSLTTPQCLEAVTWIVMARPTLVPHENYKNLTQPHFSGINNDRSVQPLGKRVVYRSREVASCSQALSSSLVGPWAVLFGCFTSNMSEKLYRSLCTLGNIKRRLFGNEIAQCDY